MLHSQDLLLEFSSVLCYFHLPRQSLEPIREFWLCNGKREKSYLFNGGVGVGWLVGWSMYTIKCRCSQCWGKKTKQALWSCVSQSCLRRHDTSSWQHFWQHKSQINDVWLCSQMIFFSLLLVKHSLASNEKGDVWIHCCCSSFLGQVGLLLFPQHLYGC